MKIKKIKVVFNYNIEFGPHTYEALILQEDKEKYLIELYRTSKHIDIKTSEKKKHIKQITDYFK